MILQTSQILSQNIFTHRLWNTCKMRLLIMINKVSGTQDRLKQEQLERFNYVFSPKVDVLNYRTLWWTTNNRDFQNHTTLHEVFRLNDDDTQNAIHFPLSLKFIPKPFIFPPIVDAQRTNKADNHWGLCIWTRELLRPQRLLFWIPSGGGSALVQELHTKVEGLSVK